MAGTFLFFSGVHGPPSSSSTSSSESLDSALGGPPRGLGAFLRLSVQGILAPVVCPENVLATVWPTCHRFTTWVSSLWFQIQLHCQQSIERISDLLWACWYGLLYRLSLCRQHSAQEVPRHPSRPIVMAVFIAGESLGPLPWEILRYVWVP